MSKNPSPRQLAGTLSVGNVVSAGLRLYRDRLKVYFGVSLRATLWALLPLLVIIPLPLLLIYNQGTPSVLSLLILIWLPLLLYCSTKFLINSALISRLAFGELVNKPESLREAYRQIDPKFWKFLLTCLLYFLISLGVMIGFYVMIFLITLVGVFIGSSVQGNIAAIVIIALIGIIAFAVVLSAMIRLFTRLFMIEVPLAIEDNLNATKTIGRSWSLTKGYVGRVFLILTLAFLLTIPLYIVAQICVSIIQTILLQTLPTAPTSAGFQILSFIVGYILGLVSGAVILPLWQTIKAVIYYDLRSRREGLDFQLRDSH